MGRRPVALILVVVFAACDGSPRPEIRQDVVLEVTRAIKAHDDSAWDELKRLWESRVRTFGHAWLDAAMTNIWCEYRRLTEAEKREMFELRLASFPQLRREASKILGRDIRRQGFGLRLNGSEWKRVPTDSLALQTYREFLAQYGATPCWDK